MRSNERIVLAVASLGHALCHVSTLVLPQVISEAARDLGTAQIGVIVALGPFLMGFGAVPAGLLGDRFGPRRIYRLYLALLLVAAAAAAFAPSVWLFVPAAALVGLAASFHHPVGLAWITEALPEQRARAMGIHGFVGHFGSTLAPLLVLGLEQRVGWRCAYGVVAIAALLLAGVLTLARRTNGEQQHEAGRGSGGPTLGGWGRVPWRLAWVPAMVVLLLAMVPNGLVHQGFWSTWTSFVKEQVGAVAAKPANAVAAAEAVPAAPGSPATLAPLAQRVAELVPAAWWGSAVHADSSGATRAASGPPLAAVAGAIATFVFAFGSLGELMGARWAKRRGGLALYAAMNAVSALGLIGAAFLRGPWLLVAGALFTFFHFGTQPVENELVARRADPRVRGVAFGLKFVVSFGIGSLATDPAIAGWSRYGFSPVFLALAGLALGGALSVALGGVLVARRASGTRA